MTVKYIGDARDRMVAAGFMAPSREVKNWRDFPVTGMRPYGSHWEVGLQSDGSGWKNHLTGEEQFILIAPSSHLPIFHLGSLRLYWDMNGGFPGVPIEWEMISDGRKGL